MAEATIDQAMAIAAGHYRDGRLWEAEQMCRQVLAKQPRNSDALNLLGTLSYHAGRDDFAIDLIRSAIAINPTEAAYHSNLGNLLRLNGQHDDAIAAYGRALALQPDLAEVYSNLGSALTQKGQWEQAISACETAIRINPNLIEAHSNLGNALMDQGRLVDAIAAYRAAIAVNPDHAEVHSNLGMCLLLGGDYASGWPEYQWRWRSADALDQTRQLSKPMWNGENLAGQTILLHAEQGFGDTIQFIRYAPLVAARGAKVVVLCQPELIELFKPISAVREWIPYGGTIPAVDFHYPLLSLPLALGTTLANIPRFDPPQRAPADRVEYWRHRLANRAAKLKVGLAWAGSAGHKNDANRSISLSQFDRFADIPDIVFYSLQIGPAGEHSKESSLGNRLVSGLKFADFADTAGLIAPLDLVISVDTAVAHLAAAMDKPVWLLLPFAPDWRWMLGRADSPWYPTMRLFRQSIFGNWTDVIERVARELAKSGGTSP